MKLDFLDQFVRTSGSLPGGDPTALARYIQDALAAAGIAGAAPGGPSTAPDSDIPAPRAPMQGTGLEALRFRPANRLRKPLGEVISALRAGGNRPALTLNLPGMGQIAPAPELPLPDGAEFLSRSFTCAAGTRSYRVYVPSCAAQGLEGLVVMLHGCTQTPEDFAAGTRMNALAEEHRLLVAYPAQTRGDNTMACWNWFRPGDQVRDAGEPAIIAGLTASLRDEYSIPADRVYVAGLSAGGAMAAILGEAYPDLYNAIGVHSGLACGSANDVVSAFAAMGGQVGIDQRPIRRRDAGDAGSTVTPRLIVFHGEADATVHPSNAERILVRHGDASLGEGVRTEHGSSGSTRPYSRLVGKREDGTHGIESWTIEGAQHAWAGGHSSGSYTDPRGPDASEAMVRFFLHGASDAPGA